MDKIIQISTLSNGGQYVTVVYGLSENGVLYSWNILDGEWRKLTESPNK